MQKIILIATILTLLFSSTISRTADPEPEQKDGSVYYNSVTGKFKVVFGKIDKSSLAYGSYKNSYEVEGWDYLDITAHEETKKYPDELKAYAMGFLEGTFTHARIHNYLLNMQHFHFHNNAVPHKMPERVKEFLYENFKYMKETATKLRKSDPYWAQVYNFYMQIKGLMDAYNSLAKPEEQISYIDFQVMNAVSDVDETEYWQNPDAIPNFSKMTTKEKIDFIEMNSHCSGLMKVAPDFSDVWFGHNTWTSFNKMIRIFKEYRFKTNSGVEKSKTVAFSGYPACLASIDDFYVLENNLYVTETTNTVYDTKLYEKYLTPKTLLSWMRTLLANRLSGSGPEWAHIFSLHNSGTYNNQFQVLDMNKIHIAGEGNETKIEDGALTIVEQIPGYVESEDMTKFLKKGYWPSYNSARIKKIRDLSGYEEEIRKDPELRHVVDYNSCARANIFRKYQSTVTDIESYKTMIRYNNYKNEPLALGNPSWTIGARKDLMEEFTSKQCYGITDAKFGSIKEVKGKAPKIIHIINGPTTSGNLTNFEWKEGACYNATGRWTGFGHVEKYEFDWVEYHTKLMDPYP